MEKILPNEVFYNELASDYDDMISFEKSIEKKKKLFKNFHTPEMKSAADIGCGSGADSIALSLLGLKVTSFDPSSEMLKKAEVNSKRMKVKVEFHNYTAVNIPKKFNENFDLVVSLGNTYANIPKEKFIESLKRCYDILKPNGYLLIQVLNYNKILIDNQRIVNIAEADDKYFIRFYDFHDEQILFNILTFSKENPSAQTLISTEVYPISSEDFLKGLKDVGFSTIRLYSDLQLETFYSEKNSRDIIVLGFKN